MIQVHIYKRFKFRPRLRDLFPLFMLYVYKYLFQWNIVWIGKPKRVRWTYMYMLELLFPRVEFYLLNKVYHFTDILFFSPWHVLKFRGENHIYLKISYIIHQLNKIRLLLIFMFPHTILNTLSSRLFWQFKTICLKLV